MTFADIKVGVHLIVKSDYPCRVNEVKLSRPGKHGHAKKLVTATDIFTAKKYQEIFTHHSTIVFPKVTRKEYQVIGLDDRFLSVMEEESGQVIEDYDLPAEDDADALSEELDAGKDVFIEVLAAAFNDDVIEKVVAVRVEK